MAKLLFKLNNVPEDEADEIRQLLDQNEVDYYETTAGNWGLSFAAIWLKNEDDYSSANELIEQYQEQRYQQAVENRKTLIDNGQQTTRWQSFSQRPILTSLVVIFVVAVLYFSIMPFFSSLD